MSRRRMRWKLDSGFLVFIILAGGGCQSPEYELVGEQRANMDEEEAAARRSMESIPEYAVATPPAPMFDSPDAVEVPQAQLAAASRVLIYNADVQVAVARIDESVQAVKAMAEELGGYMERMDGGSITIRIPAAEFFPTLSRIEQMGTVIRKQVNALDVTDEYVDLELRLKNAEAMLKRLDEILAKAANVTEVLAVEKEIGRVREEIERLQGRLDVLRKRVAMSTLVVGFNQAESHGQGVRPSAPVAWLDRLGIDSVLRIGR